MMSDEEILRRMHEAEERYRKVQEKMQEIEPLSSDELESITILARDKNWEDLKILKDGDDVYIDGKVKGQHKFSSNLDLAMIRNVNWEDPEIYNLNDACGTEGPIDWSCIRDSSKKAVKKMSEIARRKLLGRGTTFR